MEARKTLMDADGNFSQRSPRREQVAQIFHVWLSLTFSRAPTAFQKIQRSTGYVSFRKNETKSTSKRSLLCGESHFPATDLVAQHSVARHDPEQRHQT